jgi:cyclopropane-fatty-acyl-phospholipid synthase
MTQIAVTITKPGLYERIILNLFSGMNRGTLHLSLPNGRQITFGSGKENLVADIEIKDPNFFKRCVLYGDIGFGESYTDGEWETSNISNVIKWFLLNVEHAPSVSGSSSKVLFLNVLKWLNKLRQSSRVNTVNGSKKNIVAHYDLSNEFFALFLDKSMSYSAAYFKKPGMSLEDAQLAKYERLHEELKIKTTDRVLEIGSGWGSNAMYMAKKYGCHVTTLTISEEQYKYVVEKVKHEDLEKQVTVLLKDYRHMEGKFDKLISIEMLEAVGAEFYETYFKKCAGLLTKDGIFALQVITCPDSRFENLKNNVDWIQKHIFPGSLLPSVGVINSTISKVSDFSLVDLKDLGLDYAYTLKAWRTEFHKNIERIKSLGFDDYFIRKWNYYFSYCEAAFLMRNINVMQMTYCRPNNTLR